MITYEDTSDIDSDIPLLAGRCAIYVTDPHGWIVDRHHNVTATRGRLTVELYGDGWIRDSEDYSDDECQYGVPQSSSEALRLAELYREAEEILAAFRSGEYVPPPPLRAYINNRPKDASGFWGYFMRTAREQLIREINRPSLFDMFDPLEPYTRQERAANIWRMMKGLEPLQRRPKRDGTISSAPIIVRHYDFS